MYNIYIYIYICIYRERGRYTYILYTYTYGSHMLCIICTYTYVCEYILHACMCNTILSRWVICQERIILWRWAELTYPFRFRTTCYLQHTSRMSDLFVSYLVCGFLFRLFLQRCLVLNCFQIMCCKRPWGTMVQNVIWVHTLILFVKRSRQPQVSSQVPDNCLEVS